MPGEKAQNIETGISDIWDDVSFSTFAMGREFHKRFIGHFLYQFHEEAGISTKLTASILLYAGFVIQSLTVIGWNYLKPENIGLKKFSAQTTESAEKKVKPL